MKKIILLLFMGIIFMSSSYAVTYINESHNQTFDGFDNNQQNCLGVRVSFNQSVWLNGVQKWTNDSTPWAAIELWEYNESSQSRIRSDGDNALASAGYNGNGYAKFSTPYLVNGSINYSICFLLFGPAIEEQIL